MPTLNKVALFICSTFIIFNVTEIKSFILCREEFFHKYDHYYLVSFCQVYEANSENNETDFIAQDW